MNEAEFWSCNSEEEMLTHEDMDEAIEECLDSMDKPWPETIEAHGFARSVVDKKSFIKSVLEYAYDHINEQYDVEDGHEINNEIEKAAEEFVNAYCRNYVTSVCHQVKTEKVHVKAWVASNRPDWIEYGMD